ncbi:MAG: hypothetical protein A3H27_12060 [Acidobacteria bacterium RIFCSPLOWO2_02_FULL_59_13]|nr:MAG: hypothetical protein A3H27_12060 [Acidobacteria bacterium RIFCSPLOWO2_02_FULL_59_13]
MNLGALLGNRKLWAACAAGALALALLSVWAVHSYQRVQVKNMLNENPAFRNPPLEVSFPRLLADSGAVSEILEPGVAMGLWSLQRRGSQPPSWEIQLSERGRRWFSPVGNQIIAVFRLGTRRVRRVTELSGSFPSRRAHFQYVWETLHPAVGVLGEATPQAGTVYEGEALLSYEQDRWKLMHWSMAGLDQALARFRALQSPPGEEDLPPGSVAGQ